MKKFLSENDIPFIENLENFKDLEPRDLWVSNTDPHPNEKAHYILSTNLIFLDKYIFYSNSYLCLISK